jgi:UDP-hydrolysing UDP-N-acetyl-D-glucosamine 2-epimerase
MDRAIGHFKPDIAVILGDRFESLGAAYQASYHRIPICHIHGGEQTAGAMDDAMRHAISKLSHIHCVANVQFAETLSRMGEKIICVTGAPGLDNLVNEISTPRRPQKHFVVTYHPETLGTGSEGIKPLIEALERFPDYKVYWTNANQDPGAEQPPDKWKHAFETVDLYIHHCRHAAAVIGNSSSGIIEMPTLGVPTVNIGDRQKGRPMAGSVITCLPTVDSITEGIEWALGRETGFVNPYGQPGASERIADIIANQDLTGILRKDWPI